VRLQVSRGDAGCAAGRLAGRESPPVPGGAGPTAAVERHIAVSSRAATSGQRSTAPVYGQLSRPWSTAPESSPPPPSGIVYGPAKEVDVNLRIPAAAGVVDQAGTEKAPALFDRVRVTRREAGGFSRFRDGKNSYPMHEAGLRCLEAGTSVESVPDNPTRPTERIRPTDTVSNRCTVPAQTGVCDRRFRLNSRCFRSTAPFQTGMAGEVFSMSEFP